MKLIPITKGQFAIVDNEDYDGLVKWNWQASKTITKARTLWYAKRCIPISDQKYPGNREMKMHRELLGLIDSRIKVDHRNGNGLDNRRENLRVASQKQNSRNRRKSLHCSSTYKGVSWHKHVRKWLASIVVEARKKNLGYFDNQLDAAMAYNLAAVNHFGELANLNVLV